MAIYSYVKKSYLPRHRVISYISYISLTIGSFLLFWSFYPILSFEIYSRLFIQKHIATPVPRSDVASSLAEANSILGSYTVFSNNLRDFTQVNLWFPTKPQIREKEKISINEYFLSIPRLNIIDAKVLVGGSDLTKGLIQYLPQSMPGEAGNVVIFGHSTLPALYNPKDYKTIFTYLPSLEKGDKINVDVAGVRYDYEVYDMFVVNPDAVSVLEQQQDNSYLTVITCVPPGTYWKRLVVKAKLIKFAG